MKTNILAFLMLMISYSSFAQFTFDYSGDTDPPFRAMLTPLWVQFF